MRVVVCPDKFAGTLSAPAAAAAISQGWLAARPDDAVTHVPLADGGPGFIEALHAGLGGHLHAVTVEDPLGRPVTAHWLQVGDVAYVEAAQANGLHLLTQPDRDPAITRSTGVGQVIAAAARQPVTRIVVGLGGSATNDGGRGAVEALIDVPLPDLAIATDVESPLLGPHGATYGYAPQKGARPEQLVALERRMADWARQAPEMADRPGSGAAGGLGFGLMLLGARRTSGVQTVIEALDLGDRLRAADLVITGEGRFDWQSLQGKVVGGIITAAANTPVVVIAGQVELAEPPVRALSLAQRFGLAEAMANPAACLSAAASELARLPDWDSRSISGAG